METGRSHQRFLVTLVGLFLLVWGALAIAPFNRHDWLLENLLVLALVAALLFGHRHYLPSRSAATLIFLYLCIHQLGAHYTYANVPYDAWWQTLTGESLNDQMGWERNQFDRLAHLSYGLLLAYPIREVLIRLGLRPGFWSILLPVDIVLSTSAVYELIEWLGAEMLGGGLGRTFLATQNDRWDPQKDMALATTGAIVAMIVTALAVKTQRSRNGSAG
jgi:putative membrane protein